MCGIAGIVSPRGKIKDHEPSVMRMVASLSHRGPDASGVHVFDRCVLGHARLSIVDIESGQQPMLSSENRLGIVFNGEIYGYRTIKAGMKDYFFRTDSDTEVILALYEKHGDGLLRYLPGMFSFAIWNDAKKELICARDRFGEKPFYYATGPDGEFIFASEIKAILASGLVLPELNQAAVMHYLQHLYVHPHTCIYSNIHVLPPSHQLRFVDGRIEVSRYWQLPGTDEKVTMDDAVDNLRHLLRQAVQRQLVADVPVAAFLSGGVDSTTIVASAHSSSPGLRTISFGFGGDLNELPVAREASGHYGTEHIELVEGDQDIASLLVKMASIYDEPFADSSNIPTYLISRAARAYTKVVLTGDGGDELFAGYRQWYRALLFVEGERNTSAWRLRFLELVASMLERTRCNSARTWHARREGLLHRRLYGTVSAMHRVQNTYFSRDHIAGFGLNTSMMAAAKPAAWPESDTVDDALRMDLEDYMPGDILVKTDRASMANGLELRAPFLDVDLASFCITLPSRLKISEHEDKIVLRKAFGPNWPAGVRNRGKQGFGAPVGKWLKLQNVHALKQEYLDNRNSPLFDLLSFEGTREASARDDYGTWILLVLALWLDRQRDPGTGRRSAIDKMPG